MVMVMKKYPYSVGTAISYAVILLLTLWWLPILGPIIIGYITGRKAGGPVKGVVAMSIPILLYFAFIFALVQGWIHIPSIFSTNFVGNLMGVFASLPVFSFLNYIDTTLNVAMNVGAYFQHYLYYAPPSFFIMLSFAFIGGAVSRMVILERGIFPEKKPLFLRKKEKLTEEDVPRPFHSRVMLAQPVSRIRPFVMPEEQEEEEEKKKEEKKEKEDEEKEAKLSVRERRKKESREKRKKKAKRGVKRFDDQENSKFVVHPVEEPKPVVIKKKVNRNSSITFL